MYESLRRSLVTHIFGRFKLNSRFYCRFSECPGDKNTFKIVVNIFGSMIKDITFVLQSGVSLSLINNINLAIMTTSKLRFTLQLANGSVINQTTIIKGKNGIKVISTPLELCNLIKADWCKSTQSKSFTQWADELNADKNFSGGFTKEMALDNLASTYTLNINGKYVNLYQFFLQHKPFKETI